MSRRVHDDEILSVLPYATGDNREVLVRSLAFSDGQSGIAVLERLYATEKGSLRTAALFALARRTREASTQRCVEALRSTSFNLQELAALLLAEWGDGSAVPDVLEWLERKLKAPSGTGSPFVLPSAIRFATRHKVHAKAAMVIGAKWDRLTKDEREWLVRTWPGAFTVAGILNGSAAAPPPALLETDVYEAERGPVAGMSEPPDELWWSWFDSGCAQSARRASKPTRRR